MGQWPQAFRKSHGMPLVSCIKMKPVAIIKTIILKHQTQYILLLMYVLLSLVQLCFSDFIAKTNLIMTNWFVIDFTERFNIWSHMHASSAHNI